ncbi:MAG: hypothetical protein IT462_13490 [Planctomycetes bacterium]|nr:hypothetical protein [Planctomycetota bacterium]
MNRERIELLMNRSLDGAASREEKEELARALKADPVIKTEFDELAGVHNSLNSLFTKLALPKDFNKRVMRRVQPQDIPSDMNMQAVQAVSETAPLIQLPLRRSSRMQAAGTPAGRKSGRLIPMFVSIGAVSAAAALLIVIGMVTGIIGTANTPKTGPASDYQAERSGGVPRVPGHHRTDPGVAKPEREASDGNKSPSEASPGITKPEPAPVKRDGPVNAQDGAKPEVRNPEPKVGPENPQPEEPVVPESPLPEEPVTPEPKGEVVEKPVTPAEGPTSTQGRRVIGTMAVITGKAHYQAEDGKWAEFAHGADVREGANVRTSQGGIAILRLPYGAVVMGNDSNVQLMEEAHRLTLVKGEVTLERGRLDAGEDGANDGALEAIFDGSTLRLEQGTTLIERRNNKKVEIHQIIGGCAVLRGADVMAVSNGQMVAVNAGSAFEKPVSRAYLLEGWAGKARAEMVMSAISEGLASRNAKSSEATSLRGALERVLRLELSSDLTSLFLGSVLSKEMLVKELPAPSFKVSDMLAMLGTVDSALAEQKARPKEDMSYDVLMEFAVAALDSSDTVAQWQAAFKRLCSGSPEEIHRNTGSKKSPFPTRPLPNSTGCGKCPCGGGPKAERATSKPKGKESKDGKND